MNTRLSRIRYSLSTVHYPLFLALLACSLALGADSPTKSPAGGGAIVFCGNRTGAWRIWTAQPDGSNCRQLTKGDEDFMDVDPVFSPDGKSILLTSTRGGKAGLWRMQDDGSRMERICDGDQGEWSPDGKRIVFRRGEKLLVRDLAGGSEKQITPEDFAHCSAPAWSHDGKTIAFACRWDGGNGLYTVPAPRGEPAEGGKPAKVYDEQAACEPHWAPDDALLVYETEVHLCTITPDGKKNRLLTTFGGVQRYGRFSPDGKSVIFCQGPSERGPWELYVIPARGGKAKRLTEDNSDMYPDWKP